MKKFVEKYVNTDNVPITDEEIEKFMELLLHNRIRIDPRKSMRRF